MSVKWTCDYPDCGELSLEHKDWLRVEVMDKIEWWLFAVPFMGMIAAAAYACTSDSTESWVRHYCPVHAKFLEGDKS